MPTIQVMFDKGNSWVRNKETGEKVEIEERNGTYVFDLWIPKKKVDQGTVNMVTTGRYDALKENETGLPGKTICSKRRIRKANFCW